MEEDGTAAEKRLGILGITRWRLWKELWKMWITSVDGKKGGDYGKLPIMVKRTEKVAKTMENAGWDLEEK